MSIQDDKFAAEPSHAVAITVLSMMSAISDLCEMASQGIGYDLIQSDIDDLELSHARLGQLLDSLHTLKKAAQ